MPGGQRPRRPILRLVLILDAALSVGFGLAVLFWPEASIGTLFTLPEPDTAFAALLRALGVFYLVMGLAALVGAMVRAATVLLAVVMLLRHALRGAEGLADLNAPWLVGSPWPDILIHAGFVLAYLTGLILTLRARTSRTSDLR